MRRALPCAFLALAAAIAASPAQAEMRAIIMGFQTYATKQQLQGSRNDAADLSAVLGRRGVTDLTVVDETRGSRDQFEALWAALVARAKPGDILFLSFSGHGNRSPEKGEPKHTPDGYEKGFLLPAYDEATRPEEILRDEHLYDLFKAASDKGLKIVFVADACHAGLSVRSASPVNSAPPRFQTFKTFAAPTASPPDPSRVVRRPPIPNLSIYSAAEERQEIREFPLDGRMRGALSYAVARGLEGKAVAANGAVTAGSLANYVVTNVSILSENTQIPYAQTPDPGLNLSGATSTPSSSTAAAKASASVAPLGQIALLLQGNPRLSLVGATLSQNGANLAWNPNGEVRNTRGDIVAYEVTPERLQDAVDARRVLEALAKTVGQQSETMTTKVSAVGQPASDRYYLRGESVSVTASPSALTFLTVVDLTADGTVQFLWPRDSDPKEWPKDRPWSPPQAFPVRDPYGQDTVVFIRSDRALPALHAALAQMDNRRKPVAFHDALRANLEGARFLLGLHSLFTCEKLREDGSCAPSGSR